MDEEERRINELLDTEGKHVRGFNENCNSQKNSVQSEDKAEAEWKKQAEKMKLYADQTKDTIEQDAYMPDADEKLVEAENDISGIELNTVGNGIGSNPTAERILDGSLYIQSGVYPMQKKETPVEITEHIHLTGELFVGEEDSKNIGKRLFAELIKDAYRDKITAYQITAPKEANLSMVRKIQELRHNAVQHLVWLMRTFYEMYKVPVKVSIKQIDEVHIGNKTDGERTWEARKES
ncbi:MAG TPA: hypothetical protein PKM17_10660 [Syntrophorhabdus sp.]|nr:hypothetical protein [Syntrophorhabdus sp.]